MSARSQANLRTTFEKGKGFKQGIRNKQEILAPSKLTIKDKKS